MNKKNINIDESIDNPLSDLISNDIYSALLERELINEKSVRNHIIRKKYQDLRNKEISTSDAIYELQQQYPYLQFDTIRKIVYNIQ
ncbi:MAG: hypothetical protein M0P71_10685 [Melioribacteraceae bacterium]|nr:hypothetical protein [Melioribacteraceae bacterium]